MRICDRFVEDDSGDNDDEYKTKIFEAILGGVCPGLCREELGCFGVHFVWGALEGGDAEEDETDDDGDLEGDPEYGPNVCTGLWVHY